MMELAPYDIRLRPMDYDKLKAELRGYVFYRPHFDETDGTVWVIVRQCMPSIRISRLLLSHHKTRNK